MKSEIHRDEIIFKILDHKTIINEYDNYKFREFNDGLDVDEDFEREHQNSLYTIEREIKELFTYLYNSSLTDNFYFFDCPLQVYKNHYNERLEDFQKVNIDADEIDFLKLEIEALYIPETHRYVENILNKVMYSDFAYNELKFVISLNKKKEFIQDKLHKIGWSYEEQPDEQVMVRYDEYELQPQPPIFIKNEVVKNVIENPIKVTKPKETKQPSNSNKTINQTTLNNFNYKISDYSVLTKEYNFYNFYNSNIVDLCEQLKDEITDNLFLLDSDKHPIYLDLVCDTLEKSPFFNAKPSIIDKWLVKYNANIDDFPNFNKSELYKLLKTNDYYNQLPFNEFSHIENVQEDFYIHFAMLETKRLLEHTNQLKVKYTTPNSTENLVSNKIKWSGKPSHLGYIMGMLTELDYIDPPRKKDGDINYTQFSKDLLEIIDLKTTHQSLSKYLNVNTEKAQETERNFKKANFNIPHKKEVS